MIFESITYHDNLPFEISFLNVGEESKHCHKEIEILLVLRGTTHYQIYHTDYELNPGDLIIADLEDLHQIHGSSEDILMLSIHVDTKSFEDIYPNIRYMFFVCEECMAGPLGNKQILQSKLSLLKHQLAKLAIDNTKKEISKSILKEDINDLVSILVNHFQGFFMEDYQYKTSQENLNPVDLQRLSRITRFILLNYKEKITLEDVARMEHLSSFYISHLIKKTLGFNFQNFVNAIRLEFAEKYLVFSNLTLMQISEDCGFSSPNYFNKCFSAWHGKTPAEYRKAYTPCDRTYNAEFTENIALTLLKGYLNISGSREQSIDSSYTQVRVNLELYGNEIVDFWENHGPKIIINSADELLKLEGYEKKLRAIHPISFLSSAICDKDKNSETQHLKEINHATAFSYIFSCNPLKLRLFGDDNALFTEAGIATPYYHAYNLISKMEHPKISIHNYYSFMKSNHSIFFVMYNTDSYALLNAHLSTLDLPESFILIKTEYSDSENCFSILNALGTPKFIPEPLRNHLTDKSYGKSEYSTVLKNETPILDFKLQPGNALILEIIPSPCTSF